MILRDGLFYNVIPAKEKGKEDTLKLVGEFTYEYAERNNHLTPETTVSIVPFISSQGNISVAVGWAWCHIKDNPEKSKGRNKSQARALGVIRNTKADNITTRHGKTIGKVISADAVSMSALQALGFTPATTVRIEKAINFLVARTSALTTVVDV